VCLAFVLADILPPIVKVETACLSEASVSIYKAIRYNNTRHFEQSEIIS